MKHKANYYRVTENSPELGRIEYEVWDCADCQGKGKSWHPGCEDTTTSCMTCRGEGMISRHRSLYVAGTKGTWEH